MKIISLILVLASCNLALALPDDPPNGPLYGENRRPLNTCEYVKALCASRFQAASNEHLACLEAMIETMSLKQGIDYNFSSDANSTLSLMCW